MDRYIANNAQHKKKEIQASLHSNGTVTDTISPIS